MNSARALVALAVFAALLGCGRTDTDAEELRGFMARTEPLSAEFVYLEEAPAGGVEVRGRIEDAFRHSSELLLEDVLVVERVVNDDAMAIRVHDPSKLHAFAAALADPADFSVAAALTAGRWVVDPAGAPALKPAEDIENVGADPMRDALSVFVYAKQALEEAVGVRQFNPDALDYRPEDDPFPQPLQKSGEDRYDIQRPPLPRRQTGQQRGVGTPHFRKMSFYVKDGSVHKVLEEVDIEGHEEFRRALRSGRPKFLLRLLDELRAGRTAETIRVRRMSLAFTSLGERVSVELPPDSFTGNLRGLFGSDGAVTLIGRGVTSPVPRAPEAVS